MVTECSEAFVGYQPYSYIRTQLYTHGNFTAAKLLVTSALVSQVVPSLCVTLHSQEIAACISC